MRIIAISDTHMPSRARQLPETLVSHMREADLVLHAGDISTTETLRRFQVLAPVLAVSGNVDESDLQLTLPKTRVVDAGGYRIGLVHGDGSTGTTLSRARRSFDDVDCIIFGHSHSPYLQEHEGILMLNPGSATDRRREPRPSFAILTTDGGIRAKIVYL